jgi:hypothetical protein
MSHTPPLLFLYPLHRQKTPKALYNPTNWLRGFLAKARGIAELRSPARDDGTIARILWKTAQVLRENPAGVSVRDAKEAGDLLHRAYLARAALVACNEAGESDAVGMSVTGNDQAGVIDEEELFDLLVPGYYR